MNAVWRAVLPVAMLMASCNSPDVSAESNSVMPDPAKQKASITIRTMAGEPDQTAWLVEPKRYVAPGDLADALRDAGFACEAVLKLKQLEQNGERMDVYKADCLNEAYQVTLINGNSHIKRWTGNILGS
jgi:hypothetical protein